ncbi:4Fe-4S binding protein [Anaerotalea alkaliphila]|uniref:4Fe-4S binding protein n=1 Tax=Anaerotalea alkaliphila TaxID=2662126 RepID=A0A7X5HV91_9FIRM|nr:4Fe-4S binding protein [Anaerotalea alkaliphila]NDL67265.1 4Fe-4S binding protein [Anaerotalea alkaliphila]
MQRKRIRTLVQAVFFAVVALIAVNHTLAESGNALPFISTASLHALCPFGGVVSVYSLLTAGTFVQKIHASSLVMTAAIWVTALLLGPLFCGWVCPLGSFQEALGKLGRKVFGKSHNRFAFIGTRPERALRLFCYVVLVWVVYVTAKSGTLLFANLDPYNALFRFWSGEVALPAFVALGATALGSLFLERPWCKYFCPYGALLGITNRVSPFRIRRNPSTCIECGKCDRSCPMNLEVQARETVRDNQCIRCMECTSDSACPVPDTFRWKREGGGMMRTLPLQVALAILLLITGTLSGAKAAGLWITESTKIPGRITEGAAAGEYDPVDIRGSYTFGEIADLFQVELPVWVSGEANDNAEPTGEAPLHAVTGKTTFRDLLSWGVEEEALKTLPGTEAFDPGTSVRDHCERNGLEFSSIKAELEGLIP